VNFSIKLLIFRVFYFPCSEHRKKGKEHLVPGLKKKQLSLLHNLEQTRQDSRRCVKQYIYIFIFKLKIKNMITLIPEVNYEAGSDSNCLCGLVITVPGYRSRGPGFDSRRYQIF
jgi:hypothetical protein